MVASFATATVHQLALNDMPSPLPKLLRLSSPFGSLRSPLRPILFVAIGGLVALVGGCSKPTPLTGTYTATCSFKGGYRGGGRADLAWSRQCTLTLEARSETEVAMRFDSGDSVECYGHAVQTGANGERKVSFPKNDLTCRAKTLPAPAGIAVEQCPMPGTFSISEAIDKNKKTTVAMSVTLETVLGHVAHVEVDLGAGSDHAASEEISDERGVAHDDGERARRVARNRNDVGVDPG
jgi:hypothetical protein